MRQRPIIHGVEFEDLDAPIRLPRRGVNWLVVAGFAVMCVSAVVSGFAMQIMWRLIVLSHTGSIH